MTNPLLTTKLHIPPTRAHLIPRPRLYHMLDQGLTLPLTLVSAPPGCGKTSLITAWLEQRGLPTAWYSLDKHDNDLVRFLTYLVAALQTVQIDVGRQALAGLRTSRKPSLESVMTLLSNDIAAIPRDFVLVLDDYHLIELPAIHEALTLLLDPAPPRMHLVIATRADPPLSLARLRARGQLAELRMADLRFSIDEAEEFLNERMSLNLTMDQVAALEARAEGWVVGLQLAALSMRGRQDVAGFIHAFTGTHRFILDYLLEEVLQRQTPEIQTFLLQTSILDQMNAALANTLTGRDDSGQVLVQLEKDNLFVIPLDDERHWYRYHHLFADLLKNTLKQHRSEEQIHELHRRASQWYQVAGALDEAMLHTLAAQDFERAAAIIDENIDNLFNRNNPELLLGWIKDLPEEIVHGRPWMDVYYANTLAFLGQLDEVDPLIEAAEQRIKLDDPRRAEILGHITAVRAYAANLRGNGTDAIQMATLSKKYLPEGKPGLRGMVAYILADTYFASDDMQSAAQEISDLLRIGNKTGQVLMVVTALCTLANIKKVQGRLHQADELYNKAFQCMETQNGLGLRVRCAYEFGLADVLRERNKIDAALELAMTGAERLQQLGGYLMDGDLALMRIFQARGEVESAFKALRNAEKNVEIYQFQLATMIEFRTARVEQWLAVGEVETASRWARECNGGSEKEQITLARLRLAQGRPVEAQRLMEAQQPLAEAGGRFGRLIEILALQAIALNAQGLSAEADAALSQALSLAQPEGFVRVFLDLGLPLHVAKESQAAPGRASQEGLAARESFVAAAPLAQTPSEALNEAFTGRELEVLRLLADGLTNKEMAARLVVAPSTVKQHLKNICRKLDVHNRTQAVARGRELKLL